MENYVVLDSGWAFVVSACLWLVFLLFVITFVIKKKYEKLFKEHLYPFFVRRWTYFFRFSVIILLFVFYLVFVYTFNDGSLFFVKNNRISTNWEDWGGFASCLTAVFALLSVYYAYSAFKTSTEALKSQRKSLDAQRRAGERASFDAMFTQVFAQHSILFDKVMGHDSKECPFAGFVEFFNDEMENTGKGDKDSRVCSAVSDVYIKYVNMLGDGRSSNLKNFFKYIHRELTFIRDNYNSWNEPVSGDNVAVSENGRAYVRLVEGMMNNDELFFYFVNQIEHYECHKEKRGEMEEYFRFLRDNDFFEEICGDETYRKYVNTALDALNPEVRGFITGNLVKEEWLHS